MIDRVNTTHREGGPAPGKVFANRLSGIDSNTTFETRRARCGEMSPGHANVRAVPTDSGTSRGSCRSEDRPDGEAVSGDRGGRRSEWRDRGPDERPGAMTSMWSSPERRTDHCAGCDAERVFEQPPRPDDHDECPEWLCMHCGSVLLLVTASA